ncbi:MAG: histidine phosphatase family protein [Chloroherpetonaceae bacterium]|nr:histidine phosphatase family protein [Chthonomonadaceae bacterium]MDW8207228.1 histidine phosphatase family protein [Chloroherpetonaceae bacterium]
MQVQRIYVVRHGVTLWNREARFQGQTDIPLTEEGREQARRLAERLATSSPVAIWSSDLVRARDTAEIIAIHHGLRVRTTPLLRELMLGEWEGLNRTEIEARGEADRLARYAQDPLHHRPPGGEPLESAWDRVLRAAAMIRAQHPQGDLVIVGHGGSLRALLCHAIGAPMTSMRRIRLDNCSLSIIEEQHHADEIVQRLVLLNDTGHLTGIRPDTGAEHA